MGGAGHVTISQNCWNSQILPTKLVFFKVTPPVQYHLQVLWQKQNIWQNIDGWIQIGLFKNFFSAGFLPHLLSKWPPRSSCLNSWLKRKQAMNIKIEPRRRIWAIIIEVATICFPLDDSTSFVKVKASKYIIDSTIVCFNSITQSWSSPSLTSHEIRLSRHRHPSRYFQENVEFYFFSAPSTKLWIFS